MLANLGFSEIVLIFIVALLLFGPAKLPEIGRMVGKTLHEFRKAARGLIEEEDELSRPSKAEEKKTEAAFSNPKTAPAGKQEKEQ